MEGGEINGGLTGSGIFLVQFAGHHGADLGSDESGLGGPSHERSGEMGDSNSSRRFARANLSEISVPHLDARHRRTNEMGHPASLQPVMLPNGASRPKQAWEARPHQPPSGVETAWLGCSLMLQCRLNWDRRGTSESVLLGLLRDWKPAAPCSLLQSSNDDPIVSGYVIRR